MYLFIPFPRKSKTKLSNYLKKCNPNFGNNEDALLLIYFQRFFDINAVK